MRTYHIYVIAFIVLACSAVLASRRKIREGFAVDVDASQLQELAKNAAYNDEQLKLGQLQLAHKIDKAQEALKKTMEEKEKALTNQIKQAVPNRKQNDLDKKDLVDRIDKVDRTMRQTTAISEHDLLDLKQNVRGLYATYEATTRDSEWLRQRLEENTATTQSKMILMNNNMTALRNTMNSLNSEKTDIIANNKVIDSRLAEDLEGIKTLSASIVDMDKKNTELTGTRDAINKQILTLSSGVTGVQTSLTQLATANRTMQSKQNLLEGNLKTTAGDVTFLKNEYDAFKADMEDLLARPVVDSRIMDIIKVTPEENVGIGTAMPMAKLDVAGNAVIGMPGMPTSLVINDVPGGKFVMQTGNNSLNIAQHNKETNQYDSRLFVYDGGNIGVGTQQPVAKLDVAGAVRSADATGRGYVQGADDANGIAFMTGEKDSDKTVDIHSSDAIRFFTDGALKNQTEKMRLNARGVLKVNKSETDVWPTGWGAGVHADYVYASAGVGAGKDGVVNAAMSADGTLSARNVQVVTGATDNNWVQVNRGTNDQIWMGSSATQRGIKSVGSRDFSLYTGEQPRMTMKGTAGNIGIGTTEPSTQHSLHVKGNVMVEGDQAVSGDVRFVGANRWAVQHPSTGNRSLSFVPSKTAGADDWNADAAVVYGPDGSLSAKSLEARGSITLPAGQSLSAAGRMNMGGAGQFVVQNKLGMTVSKDAGGTGNMTVEGGEVVKGTLNVKGGTTFNSDVVMSGNALVRGTTTVANATVGGTLNINGTLCSPNGKCMAGQDIMTHMVIPSKTIVMWSGSTAPDGWVLCDGGKVTLRTGEVMNTPDLRNRFVLGWGSRTAGTMGGSETVTLTVDQMPSHAHTATVANGGDHTHTGTTNASSDDHTHTMDNGGDHSHTTSENGNHNHNLNMGNAGWVGNEGNYGSWSSSLATDRNYGNWNVAVKYSGSHSHTVTTSGSSHSHTIKSGGAHSHSFTTSLAGGHAHAVTVNNTGGGQPFSILPPFYVLAFIMKL